MRFLWVVMFVFAAAPAAAQTGSSPAVETRPFRLNANGLKNLLVHCDPTTLAGAAKTTRNALLTGAAAAVIGVLAADSAEGRAESEFLDVLVSKLRPTAAYGAFDGLQLKAYQESGYKLTDQFEVCTSTIGPSQLEVVRPLAPSLIPQPIAGLQTLPTASLTQLKGSILGQDAHFSLSQFVTPACTAPTSDLMSEMRMGSLGLYRLYGTVSQMKLGGLQPASGARVDVIGPTPNSCITSNTGQFEFWVTQAKYTVNVSEAPDWSATEDVKAEPFGTSLDIVLLPESLLRSPHQ